MWPDLGPAFRPFDSVMVEGVVNNHGARVKCSVMIKMLTSPPQMLRKCSHTPGAHANFSLIYRCACWDMNADYNYLTNVADARQRQLSYSDGCVSDLGQYKLDHVGCYVPQREDIGNSCTVWVWIAPASYLLLSVLIYTPMLLFICSVCTQNPVT